MQGPSENTPKRGCEPTLSRNVSPEPEKTSFLAASLSLFPISGFKLLSSFFFSRRSPSGLKQLQWRTLNTRWQADLTGLIFFSLNTYLEVKEHFLHFSCINFLILNFFSTKIGNPDFTGLFSCFNPLLARICPI